MINSIISVLIVFMLMGCAGIGVTPEYETVSQREFQTAVITYIDEFEPVGIGNKSSVEILGLTINPEGFLRRDISDYFREAIEQESMDLGLFSISGLERNANYVMTGTIKEFTYRMNVEEIPMKGEGYAYYYMVEFDFIVNCKFKEGNELLLDKDYQGVNKHATVFHILTNWEKPFVEDLNYVISEIVQDVLKDIEEVL